MNKELLVIGNKQIANLIEDAVGTDFYVYHVKSHDNIALHNFSNTTAILDVSFLTESTISIKNLVMALDLAAENSSRYLFFYPKKTTQAEKLEFLKTLIEEYDSSPPLRYTLIEVGDVYGHNFNTTDVIDELINGIIKSQKIRVEDDDEPFSLLNEKDFMSAIVSLLEHLNFLEKTIKICPLEDITFIELAHFAKETTDLPVKIEYSDGKGEWGKMSPPKLAENGSNFPPNWEPKVTLEDGLKSLFRLLGIPVLDDALREKEEEELKVIQEELALRAKLSEEIKGESIPNIADFSDYSERVNDTQRISVGFADQLENFSLGNSTAKANDFVKKSKFLRVPTITRTKVISLTVLLVAMNLVPTIVYAKNTYEAVKNIQASSHALKQSDVDSAKNYSKAAVDASVKLKRTPLLALLLYNSFGYTKKDVVNLTHNIKSLAELNLALSRAGENYEPMLSLQSDTNVLGASTDVSNNSDLSNAITMIESLKSGGLSDKNFIDKEITKLVSEYIDLEPTLVKLKTIKPEISNILGFEKPQTYLIIIQNSGEIRPSGGTIEALGLLKIDSGRVYVTNFVDAETIDNKIESTETGAIPPLPIRKIFKTNELHIKDAGWDPDFSSSAKLIAKLYKAATRKDVDGVIAFDTNSLSSLLDTLGDVQVESYNTNVNSTNVSEKIKENFITNQKNSFITDLATEIFKKVSQKGYIDPKIAKTIFLNLENKHVMFFSKDDAVETALAKNSWAGQINPFTDDYLYVVDSNMGSKIANFVVTREIEFTGFKPQKETGYLRNLKITYTHSGTPNPQVYQGYLNYVRIIIPQNTFLNSAKLVKDGKETVITRKVKVSPYGNRAMYSTTLLVKPGEKVTLDIEYESPKQEYDDKKINLAVQKQPGIEGDKLSVRFVYPSGIPKNTTISKGGQIQKNTILYDTTFQFSRDFEFPL